MTAKAVALLLSDLGVTKSPARTSLTTTPTARASKKTIKHHPTFPRPVRLHPGRPGVLEAGYSAGTTSSIVTAGSRC
jgi:hypothetical protein